jgi:hypothetical protein
LLRIDTTTATPSREKVAVLLEIRNSSAALVLARQRSPLRFLLR